MRTLVALLLCISMQALAQYPTKAVRVVIPFPPGGATDIIGRVVAQKMSERWKQPVVVENRPGAGGTIGSDLVAKSAPDGYTLLIATNSTHAVAAVLGHPPYDPAKDFTPISLLAYSPNVLVVGADSGIGSLRELIAAAKASPGRLSYASSGNGTIIHLTGELFRSMAGLDLLHVPYKGTQLAVPDVAAGRVTMIFDNIVSAQPHLKAGTVKALAVTTLAHSALAPELPTMAEAGLPGFESSAWFALFGPAGLPREVQSRAHAAALAAVTSGESRMRLIATGADPLGADAEQLAKVIRTDIDKWARVVKAGNIKAE